MARRCPALVVLVGPALVVLVGPAGGCERIAPFSAGPGRPDGPTVVVDGAPPDVASGHDLARDAGPDLGPAVDVMFVDLMADGCDPPASTFFNCCTASPVEDADCDGLLDWRDPLPADCNPVLLNEEFLAPLAFGRWSGADSLAEPACGVLDLPSDTRLSLAENAAIDNKLHLAELEFSLPAAAAGVWSIELNLPKDVNTGHARFCWLLNGPPCPQDGTTWLYLGIDPATDADTCLTGRRAALSPTLAVGQPYLLQGWSVETPTGAVQPYQHHCRVVDPASGDELARVARYHEDVALQTTIEVYVFGRAAAAHAVRAFEIAP